MRIAFITFEYPPFIVGGAGIYALNLTRELSQLGHEVVVFTPDILESISGLNFDNLEIRKVPVNKKLPFKALQFWIRLPRIIEKIEKTNRFDIIHFNGISYWFLKKRVSKAKHIVTIHHLVKNAIISNNLSNILRIKDINGENSFFMPLFERRCIQCSDKLIAVSDFTKKQIIKYYNISPSQIEVVYNGTDLNGYLFTKDNIVKTKKRLNLIQRPVLLFVGRVDDPRKGLDFLFRSINKVLDTLDVTLLVVGKGNQMEARKIADSLGISKNVIFAGFVDETTLKKYYSLCDIYICSSKLEGFGLTIVEAMIAGKPIIATKVGAIPEIIRDKVNGILVEPGDIKSMSKAIVDLIENKELAVNIGLTNYKYATNYFSWTKCAKKVEEVYS